ncbi:MAG: DUF2786 domain-containing protein [Rhodospirillaceae bacterium]|nr:DUF2786 domain-containing protein [Rhodospirillaceae bacterium]
MNETEFTAKERSRFRKLLEVANSTTYIGERDAAMNAATRLAAGHSMTLREAAGMAEAPDAPEPDLRQKPRRPGAFGAGFGAAAPEYMGTWWRQPHQPARPSAGFQPESERVAAEKRRLAEAMADAVGRGLDAEERAAAERAVSARSRRHIRTGKRGAWRARPEFIRVLLVETGMTAKEIAAAAGVTIYEVFREKLLMRRAVGKVAV